MQRRPGDARLPQLTRQLTPDRIRDDDEDLAAAASWVAGELVESAVDLGRELTRHEAYSSEMAEEARLPTSFLLASAVVAVPALIEAHAAAEAELQMPGPKVFLCNAAVLVGSSMAFLLWLCVSTARLAPATTSSNTASWSEAAAEWLQGVPGAAWHAYQAELAERPVVVKALLTGWTYVVGDMIAQLVQQTHEVVRQQLRPRPCLEKLLRMDQVCPCAPHVPCTPARRASHWSASRHPAACAQGRYLRSGLVGLCPLGPFAHWYYEFVATRLGEWPVACKIFLDQTLCAPRPAAHAPLAPPAVPDACLRRRAADLASYNSLYYLGLGILSGRPPLEVAAQYRQQCWQLLTAGWRIWPWVGIVTYTYIPQEHRVLFVDLVEIVYSAMLSTLTSNAHAGYAEVSTSAGEPMDGPADNGEAGDAGGVGGDSDRRSSTASLCSPEPGSSPGAAHVGPQPSPTLTRPPRTWEELVEVGGPSGALHWCLAGTLPDTVTSRLDRPPSGDARSLT